MSLLSIVDAAALRCNSPVPSVCIGNSDPTVQQFVAFAQDAGDELAERYTWGALERPSASQGATPATITGDGSTVIFPLPSDWGRFSPSNVITSSIYPTLTLSGPINDEDLLRLKQLPFTPLPSVWRLVGDPSGVNSIEFYPAPAAGEVLSFVYGSYLWITNASGVPYSVSQWHYDNDLSLIPDRLIMLGCIWRWKRAKGLDYAEEFNMCERSFDRRSAQEGGGRTIRMSTEPLRGEEWWPGTITDQTRYPEGT